MITYSPTAARFVIDRKQRGMSLDERRQARREIEEFFIREAEEKAAHIMTSPVCGRGEHGRCAGESTGVGCLCTCHDHGVGHAAFLGEAEDGWRARCTCGWSSDPYESYTDADTEAIDHEESVR